MDRVTRAKLDSLVHELETRSEEELGAAGSIEAIARRFQLDPMIVRRVAEQHGLCVAAQSEPELSADEGAADPNQTTQVMSLDDLLEEQ